MFGHTGVRKEIVLNVVVYSKRATDQITFPLHKQDRKLEGVGEDKEWFKAETPLEQQVTDLLAVCQAVIKEGEEFSEVEKKGLVGMTIREAMERKDQESWINQVKEIQKDESKEKLADLNWKH